MSAESPAFVRSFRVGKRTVTLSMPMPRPGTVSSLVIEWDPDVPSHLSDRELAQYRRERDKALADLSNGLGIETSVIEI
jgi:hypothetical protein